MMTSTQAYSMPTVTFSVSDLITNTTMNLQNQSTKQSSTMMTSTQAYSMPNVTVSDLIANTTMNLQNITGCSDAFPSTEELLRNVSDLNFGLGVACLAMTILVVVLYAEEVFMLKTTYTDKEERMKVMCLLGIYPVFSLCSLCGLIVPRSYPLTDFLSTFYLSMAMFIFQRMIVLFMTGERNLVRVFDGSHLPLAVPPLCCLCPCIFRFIRIRVTTNSIITVRLFVLQGAVIRPVISFCYGIYYLNMPYENSSNSLVTTLVVIKGLSMMLSMFGLQMIYRLTRGILKKEYGQHRILAKFSCFQMVILFGLVQPNIFNLLRSYGIPKCSPPFGTKVLSLGYNNIVTVFEMFAIAIIARYVYHQKLNGLEPETGEPDASDKQSVNGYATDNPAVTVSTISLAHESDPGSHL